MKKINESELIIGDIVLTTTNHTTSKGIRLATNSDISHATLYVQSHSLIDSTPEGVQARSTQRIFFDDNCSVYVMRLKKPISQDKMQKVIDHARSLVGTEYSKKEALKTKLRNNPKWKKRQFCSRLVAQSYAAAGIQLVPDVNFCSPQELKESPLLKTIKNSIMNITDQEIKNIENILDTSELMRNATNKLLASTRKIHPEIQDFNDIIDFLILHPEYDDCFAEIYKKSGYLTVWKNEADKNSWQYDIELMNNFGLPPHLKKEYCKNLLEEKDEGLRRYKDNYIGYINYSRSYPLKTFLQLRQLYENLITIHSQRIQVAKLWLENN